jgi:peroxiredoxin Q/BCP
MSRRLATYTAVVLYDPAMANLNTGDPMPDSTLVGPEGPTQLRERIGKPLVVYFYPKDETYGCTKEACSFRDQYEDFVSAGAEVIGISRDDAASHAKFRDHHRLPFTLLSDPGGSVATKWGVRSTLGIPGRVTFVFDKQGVVRHRFDSMLRFGKHVDEALEVVKALR